MTREEINRLPPVLYTKHMAAIFGKSGDRIRQQVKQGTFPIPRLERETRLAWSRARVQEFFAAETFAATNRRTA